MKKKENDVSEQADLTETSQSNALLNGGTVEPWLLYESGLIFKASVVFMDIK